MTTWTPTNKSSTPSFTGTSKSSVGNDFLLLENGSYILLEDGTSKIILEQSSPGFVAWTPTNKSP